MWQLNKRLLLTLSIILLMASIARAMHYFKQGVFISGSGVRSIWVCNDLDNFKKRLEYCGRVGHHDYQPYLAINTMDHTKTKAMSPQTNGICDSFHKTILNEFYQVTFRKKLCGNIKELQKDLDEWLVYCNNDRAHKGKMCCGRTPMETLLDGKTVWAEKNLAQS